MSTARALEPPSAVFREEQHFDWRVYATISIVEVLTALALGHNQSWSGELVVGLTMGMGFVVVIVFLLYMTTEVTPTDIRVWFGWFPTYRRVISLGSVRRIEVVTYRPIADYGFWGVRSGRDGERALIARGNRGVRLELTDGTRLLIGSQRPEVLAIALEQSLRPGA